MACDRGSAANPAALPAGTCRNAKMLQAFLSCKIINWEETSRKHDRECPGSRRHTSHSPPKHSNARGDASCLQTGNCDVRENWSHKRARVAEPRAARRPQAQRAAQQRVECGMNWWRRRGTAGERAEAGLLTRVRRPDDPRRGRALVSTPQGGPGGVPSLRHCWHLSVPQAGVAPGAVRASHRRPFAQLNCNQAIPRLCGLGKLLMAPRAGATMAAKPSRRRLWRGRLGRLGSRGALRKRSGLVIESLHC